MGQDGQEVAGKVARQYTDYIYPEPDPDITIVRDYTDPSLFGPMLWPEGKPRQDLDILVAGCGSQQGAVIALRNPSARVIGVDLSPASLAHERSLVEKHGLTNLELHQGDLRDVAAFGRRFDLVISSGVLHHMADPGEGLRALREVLKPGGVMSLMVYGLAGRRGVYVLQDAFRRLGLGQTPEDIVTVREALQALGPDHCVKPYMGRARELAYDTAIVDTFLHPQDRAYTVPELLEWLEVNGLEFQTWMQNHVYYPEALIGEPLRTRIARLPVREQWAVVESLLDVSGTHIFVAREAGRSVRIDFDAPGWLDYRPSLLPPTDVHPRADGGFEFVLYDIRFPLTPAEAALVGGCDGGASIAQILARPPFEAFDRAEREAFARTAFTRFWKIGAMMFEYGPPAA